MSCKPSNATPIRNITKTVTLDTPVWTGILCTMGDAILGCKCCSSTTFRSKYMHIRASDLCGAETLMQACGEMEVQGQEEVLQGAYQFLSLHHTKRSSV